MFIEDELEEDDDDGEEMTLEQLLAIEEEWDEDDLDDVEDLTGIFT